MACTFSVEFEAQSDAQKIWDFVKKFHTICPQAFPQLYDSVEVIEDEGKPIGTVCISARFQKQNIKEMLDLVDDENKTISCTFLGGDIFEIYKSFKATLVLKPKGDGKGFMENLKGKPELRLLHTTSRISSILTFRILDKYLISK